MKKRILVIAPHPDDETLGVGGTILRYKSEGHSVAWVIVSEISVQKGWPPKKVIERSKEIETVSKSFGFDNVFKLGFPSMELEQIPAATMVNALAKVIVSFKPTEIYLPHPGDAHSDHKAVFEASISTTKWFRYPYVDKVFVYETLSETDAGMSTGSQFHPNWFIDVTPFISKKLQIMEIYKSEVGEFPFPRSLKAIESLAAVRGTTSGFNAAESFQLLRARV